MRFCCLLLSAYCLLLFSIRIPQSVISNRTMPDLIIRGRRVVTPESVAPAAVHISDGVITAIGSDDEIPSGCEVIEAGEHSIVMPGLVDTHVHINEPGRTSWEG